MASLNVVPEKKHEKDNEVFNTQKNESNKDTSAVIWNFEQPVDASNNDEKEKESDSHNFSWNSGFRQIFDQPAAEEEIGGFGLNPFANATNNDEKEKESDGNPFKRNYSNVFKRKPIKAKRRLMIKRKYKNQSAFSYLFEGTNGYVFRPICDRNSHNEKLFYQHICTKDAFITKSPEELRFEDRFGKHACASFANSDNNLSNNTWKWPFDVQNEEKKIVMNIDECLIDQVSSACFVSTDVGKKALESSKWDAAIAMNKINSLKLFECDLNSFGNENTTNKNQNELSKLKDQIQSLCVKIDNLKNVNDQQQVVKASDVLYCRGIPYFLTEEQVRELLQSYGELSSLCLAKDNQSNGHLGYCWFQYKDASITERAIAGLNKIIIGDKALVVTRNSVEQNQASN